MRTIKRRRAEGKTDYKLRLSLLKSKTPRVVFRKTNRYVLGQYIKSREARDSVEKQANSAELKKFGWPKELSGSLKSLPAAYLCGFLLGKRVIEKEENAKAILDIGLIRNSPKSRIYAFAKGVIDAGIKMNCNEEVFPEEARIKGKHMKKSIDFNKIKEKIENE